MPGLVQALVNHPLWSVQVALLPYIYINVASEDDIVVFVAHDVSLSVLICLKDYNQIYNKNEWKYQKANVFMCIRNSFVLI